jgi:hypothetical protein
MIENAEFSETSVEIDAWVDEVVEAIEKEYDELLEKKTEWSDQVVVRGLADLKDSTEQSIRRVCASEAPDEEKKLSIRDIVDVYEDKKSALLTRLR